MKYIFAITISIAGLCFSIFFLKPSTWTYALKNKNEPIATLLSSTHNIKRKYKGGLIWNEVNDGTSLFQGDSVQTSESSTATLEFIKSKTLINIEEATTILVEMNKDEINLDIVSGQLFVNNLNSANKIKLKSGNKLLDISKAEASISVNKNGNVEVAVDKGQISTEVNGKTLQLKKNEVANIDDTGLEVEKVLFKELTPKHNESIYPSNKNLTMISWLSLKNNKDVNLLLGPSADKLKKIKSIDIAQQSNGKIFLSLRPGIYYWKLQTKNSTNQIVESPLHQFVLKKFLPSQIITPRSGESIQISSQLNSKTINLAWIRTAGSEGTVLQISKKENFNPMLFEKNIEKNTFSLDLKEPGTYYWRIVDRYNKNRNKTASQISKFNVTFYSNPPAPKLLFPNHEEMIPSQKESTNLKFVWKHLTGVKSYNIILSSLEDLKPYKSNQSTNKNEILITDLKPGKYSWKVASRGVDDKLSAYSKSFTFTIKPNIQNKKELNIDQLFMPPAFAASLSKKILANNSGSFKVTISSSTPKGITNFINIKDLSNKVIQKVKMESQSATVSNMLPGSYLISLIAQDKFGRESSESETRLVLVPNTSEVGVPQNWNLQIE